MLIKRTPEERYQKLYQTIWKKLNRTTPLSEDCGNRCGKICCSGSENDGMLLFPYEELLYREIDPSWFHLKESNISLPSGQKIYLLVCNGNCPRELRPLSCRIFPLTPYLNQAGRVDFRLDLRGIGICPLVYHPENNPLEEKFIGTIYRAFPPLLREAPVIDFIEILSRQHDETLLILKNFQKS